ncbi:hypothetical protein [Actinacidiphila rubida]|uniref:Knr4/Smi1-like domain-containing protein n=1 Tax=Actinacidiphila rubida TaxID=310780 RepID=A0A1H8J0G1_9ACTN|nr:hypothetical protein [Actinacidiphila rubida]SEN74363.1 hypothetical protein SAMN05216267_100999 [Actinacidiphila rubida]
MSSKAELLRLLQPPAEKWPLPSREEIEQGYGSALPADYLWLAGTYGLGEISRYLSIFPPLAASEIGTRTGVFPTSAESSEFDDGNEGLDPAYLKPGGLLMWGFNHNDDFAFWSPVGDPATWPIVIRRHLPQSGPNWIRYDLGIVEFLVRTFHGQLAGNPFSGDDLWHNTSPTFERG